MHMCLPFGALIREIWYSDRGISSEITNYINWVYFGQIIVVVKAPNLVKTGCFSCQNGILMGGKLGKKLYGESHIYEVRQAHPRTILVKEPPPRKLISPGVSGRVSQSRGQG